MQENVLVHPVPVGWQVPNTMFQREENERERGVVTKMYGTRD